MENTSQVPDGCLQIENDTEKEALELVCSIQIAAMLHADKLF